ncbi:hypothetical protein [Alteribacillus bidgolensis]|uniref:Uncharacterized protein n=1 Tax=Alteribacillus bidgolensis TaxID=930129 RepID=A0A1G8E7F4_9BACI|nr:hypothetical protein [Alteribacillus bidgolensis]SDH65811.1 hypothetical protein SAMN05216352_102101 [Alteribacillus bidgolensis]
MVTVVGAVILPFFLTLAGVRLTHSFIGGVLVALMITVAFQPWEMGLGIMLIAAASLAAAIPVGWRIEKHQKTGP